MSEIKNSVTVATVTAVAYRTCTVPVAAGVLPCAGRRRRDLGDLKNEIEPEPSIIVVLGTTTMTDQAQVSSILHLDSISQNPQNKETEASTTPESFLSDDATTLLYPSHDSAVGSHEILSDDGEGVSSVTTNTPGLGIDATENTQQVESVRGESSVDRDESSLEDINENARINFAGTTTVS